MSARRTGIGRREPEARERGFALLIVLWSMALLALVFTRVVAGSREETRVMANLRAAAIAEAAADDAVFEAMIHVLDGSAARWPADGALHRLRLPQAVADVAVYDEGRKITLNGASRPLLLGLMQAVGLDPRPAATLADQIADWRSPTVDPLPFGAKGPQYRAAGLAWGPPSAPFRTIDELGLLLAMTPEVLERLRGHVSPYVTSQPRAASVDPVIAQALRFAASSGAPRNVFDEPPVVTIVATAVGTDGGRFTRRAVFRLNIGPAAEIGQPLYWVLDWDQGAS